MLAEDKELPTGAKFLHAGKRGRRTLKIIQNRKIHRLPPSVRHAMQAGDTLPNRLHLAIGECRLNARLAGSHLRRPARGRVLGWWNG